MDREIPVLLDRELLVTPMQANDRVKYRKRNEEVETAPCDTCVCSFICAGQKSPEDPVPNWGLAMSCPTFTAFCAETAFKKKKVLNQNRLPSRSVYVKMFG